MYVKARNDAIDCSRRPTTAEYLNRPESPHRIWIIIVMGGRHLISLGIIEFLPCDCLGLDASRHKCSNSVPSENQLAAPALAYSVRLSSFIRRLWLWVTIATTTILISCHCRRSLIRCCRTTTLETVYLSTSSLPITHIISSKTENKHLVRQSYLDIVFSCVAIVVLQVNFT